MRQGQQNRRGRGRNNNNNNNSNTGNRKSQNPLTRSFESSGPDVKVRGTPAHIAEKYITLARDALSSGDPVLAESYLQHAEHYNRIILTYREQQMAQGGEYQGALPRAQTFNAQDPTEGDDFGDEDGEDLSGNVQPQAVQGEGQQPGLQNPGQSALQHQRPYDGPPRYDNRPPRHDNNRDNNRGEHRQNNSQRQDRDGNRFDRNDRFDNRGDRNDNRNFNRNDHRSDRNGGGEPRDFRDDRGPPPGFAGEAPVQGNGGDANNGNGQRRRERFQGNFGPGGGNGDRQPPAFAAQPPMPVAQPLPPVQAAPPPPPPAPMEAEQPAFLRRPVRRPRRDDSEAAPAPRAAPVSDEQE